MDASEKTADPSWAAAALYLVHHPPETQMFGDDLKEWCT
jgi:hypothetical protein